MDTRGDSGQFERPLGRSGMGQRVHRGGSGRVGEVWDGSGDPRGGLHWMGRSGMGRGTLGEVWNGSGYLR